MLLLAGENPTWLRNDAALAALCRASPIQASSGKTTRHRLNRGGNRQANSALWPIATNRTIHHPQTRAYVARRTTQGKSTKEISRCLMRHIARGIYPSSKPTSTTPNATPPLHRSLKALRKAPAHPRGGHTHPPSPAPFARAQPDRPRRQHSPSFTGAVRRAQPDRRADNTHPPSPAPFARALGAPCDRGPRRERAGSPPTSRRGERPGAVRDGRSAAARAQEPRQRRQHLLGDEVAGSGDDHAPHVVRDELQWHLRKVFTKLGIQSRRELSRALPRSGAKLVPA